MDYSQLSLMTLMKAKMQYGSARQSALAQNIANADTPDYKAMDIAPPDFSKMVAGSGQKLQMTVTSPQHLTGSSNSSTSLRVEKRKTSSELNPDGNNVVIEEEMSKAAQNQGDYQTMLNLYAKQISLFKTAIGNSSSGG